MQRAGSGKAISAVNLIQDGAVCLKPYSAEFPKDAGAQCRLKRRTVVEASVCGRPTIRGSSVDRGHIWGKGLMTVFDLDLNSTGKGRRLREPRGHGAKHFAAGAAELCVVVPTYNERDNIPELVERVKGALNDVAWEMIIVDDDSPDGTAQQARALGRADSRIRVMRRIGRRGLSSACIEGMLASNAAYLAVMDADLQHDPLLLRKMIEILRTEEVDAVVASRSTGMSAAGWSEHRVTARRLAVQATRVVRPLSVSDPMSGYFAVRREVIDRAAPLLVGLGFKLLLDILLAAPDLRVRELPLASDFRTRGESKFSPRVVWDYGVMLAEHRMGAISSRLLAYMLIAAVALIVHVGAFWLFYELYGLGLGGSQLAAGTALCVATYGLQEWLSYHRTGPWRWYLGLVPFLASRAIGLIAAILIAHGLAGAGLNVAVAALAGAVALAWWNYDAVHRYAGFAR
jgi:dolichol-phosphate mannosyltransferase